MIEDEVPGLPRAGATHGALAAAPVALDRWWGALVLRFEHAPPKWLSGSHEALRWAARLAGWAAERARAESELLKAESRYRTLAETLPRIVYSHTDGDKRFLYMSPQVEDILGYGPERWIRDPTFGLKLLHPEDLARIQGHCQVPTPSSHMDVAVYRQIRRDGRVVTMYDASVLRPSPAEGSPVWSGVCVDVSELARATNEMETMLGGEGGRTTASKIERAVNRACRPFGASAGLPAPPAPGRSSRRRPRLPARALRRTARPDTPFAGCSAQPLLPEPAVPGPRWGAAPSLPDPGST